MSRALWAGVTGLNANSLKLDVIGNNIANMQTTAYKTRRALFGDLFYQTISGGTAGLAGGTAGINPVQVGTGTTPIGIDVNFNQGAFLTTENVTDVAISGNGFFILDNGSDVVYTRDGAFSVDLDGSLIAPFTGYRVQGWQATDGVVNTAASVGDLLVPLGTQTVATATSNVELVGNLDASDTNDGEGTNAFSAIMYDDGAGGAQATAATLLTNLENSVGTDLDLEAGDYITVNARKGSGAITTRTFTVGATGNTLGDLATFMQEAYGIVSDGNTAATEQVTVSGGMVALQGNIGVANALTAIFISGADVGGALTLDTAVLTELFQPDVINGFSETTAASGESSFTQMFIFDSLGVEHAVDVIFSRADASANIWSYFAVGDDNYLAGTSGVNLVSTAGTMTFNSSGTVTSFIGNSVTINLTNGATTPLRTTVDGSDMTQFGTDSNVVLDYQDGFPPGTLESFTIAATGVISGIFSNGLTQNIGQIALANFTNPDGLLAEGDNLFRIGANSGAPQIGEAATGGRGNLNSGFLEQSNVDLAREFSELIITQRAYQANARTITAADALLAEAVNLV